MKKRGLAIIISIILFLAAGTGGVIYYLYNSVKATANRMYEPLLDQEPAPADQSDGSHSGQETTPIGPQNEALSDQEPASGGEENLPLSTLKPTVGSSENHAGIKQGKPICILVLGVDQRKNDYGRSDTLVIAAFNPQKNSVLLFNIPRDTRTDIIGHGTVDKINHAYAFGDVRMSLNTVEHFLGISIPYYIKINMESFEKIIDDIGGVDVDNKFAFQYEGLFFPQGEQHLNGYQALKYSRMRKIDPQGDLGRNERQRQIIKAAVQKTSTITTLLSNSNILDTLGSNVKTNISFDEMKEINGNYRSALNHIHTTEIKGSGKMINGIYYYMVAERERERVAELLRDQLALP